MEEFKYLIPEESMDAIINNVDTFREIENDLRNIFKNHNCNEVLMPSFEYVDLYDQLDIGLDRDRMFQYINHESKNVAMRVDYTIPLARLYANSYKNEEKRFSYFGTVYRKERMHKGRSSEFYQCGIELMGNTSKEGDNECLRIIEEALPKLKLDNVIIELGSARFFNRLIELVGDYKNEITNILSFRNISEMEKLVLKANFDKKLTKLLIKLPTLLGSIEMLDETINDLNDQELIDSLNEIKESYNSLKNRENILFDLGMVPSMKYYTGLMIRGYSSHSASPILSGGRYDDILPRFECNKGAIGFSFNMNRILDALESEEDHD
ncbi:MAG: ATP phosphoribosyltransferase regulatory subunit [Thomasclavelia sp.]|nr:ATP phosphoribosyltransferase regulatory subunit [Thomasclavelia sp.]